MSLILNEKTEKLLKERYYVEGENWLSLCERQAETFSGGDEEFRKKIFDIIYNRYASFSSPAIMNANKRFGMLSSCFICNIEDNIESIWDAAKETALIFKKGGGAGYNISALRPKNALIKSTGGRSSGPLSLGMGILDATAESIRQGGLRKGAMMIAMDIDHPDIEEFIVSKTEEGKYPNCNISVTITDAFMAAVNDDADWDLKFEDTVYKTVKAKELFNLVAKSAWKNGEPGIIFIDRVNRDNFVPHLGTITHPNPCSEFFNLPNSSCNLASINLAAFIIKEDFDWEGYKKTIRIMTRALDNGIDVNKFPIQKIAEVTKNIRPVGLGVMGLADVLISKGLKYSSKEGRLFAKQLLEILAVESLWESNNIAIEKGSFPTIKESLWDKENLSNNSYMKALIDNCQHYTAEELGQLVVSIKNHGIRNMHTTVIAPTGSISQIVGDFAIAGGIEPFYKMEYKRRIVTDGGDRWEDACAAPAEKFKAANPNTPLPDYFEDAASISWKDHIKMQAELQKVVMGGISKTINLPNSATIEEVKEAYTIAWALGCKGLTIYRDGSREKQVLTGCEKKKDVMAEQEIKRLTPWGVETPVKISLDKTEAAERHILIDTEIDENGKSKLYVFVTLFDDYYPIELVTKFDAETKEEFRDEMKYRSLISRLISVMLRYGIPLEEIIKQLQKTSGNMFDFIGQVNKILITYLNSCVEEDEFEESEKIRQILHPPCKNCGADLIFQEGCFKCLECGSSKC